MTIRVTINGKVNPSTWDAMTQFLTLNLPNVRHFTGNQRVSVLYDNTNNELLLDEVWASVEAHQAYLASIADSGVLAQLQGFLTAPPTIKYFADTGL